MQPDVLVVGAGHNGLTCAAYLARAGKRVLVLESHDDVGGMAYTKELAGAPGYRISPCAVDFDFFTMPNSVTDELGLDRYGLKLTVPDPWGCHINPEGGSVAFWRDIERTRAEIARFSRKDAERYGELMDTLLGFVRVAMPYLQGDPVRPGAKTIGEIVWRACRERRHLTKAARILAASPRQVLTEWFEREEVRAPFAVLSSLSMMPLDAPGTNFGLLFGPFMHGWGLRRGEGGTGALTGALAAYVRAHGGRIRCGARVAEILVGTDGADGVVLADGEEVRARQVVAAVDPTTLLSGLLDEKQLPERTRDELRGMSVYGFNISHFKVDLAVRRVPALRGQTEQRSAELLNGVLLHATSLETAHRAMIGHCNGEHSQDDPFMIVVPSAADRTLVPSGDGGEVLYLWGVCPYEPRDIGWAEHEPAQTARWIDVCDTYSPGFAGEVIAHQTQAPPDFVTRYGAKGHLYHADMTPSQLGPWRPIPSLAGYRTPVPRLWHSGAGAHPMPGINGYSGRSCARAVLKS